MSTSDKIADQAVRWRTISSGETEQLEQLQEEWFKLYQEDNNIDLYTRWSYDQVMENPAPFLEEIRKLKVIPAYRYVVNYLMMRWMPAIGEADRKGLIRYLEAGDLLKQERGSSAQRAGGEPVSKSGLESYAGIYQALVRRLDQSFRENGYQEAVDWNTFFRELVEGFDYEKLKFLALGVHMPVNDFEIFLCKVLRRAHINFYDRDEVLLYLTLEYGDDLGYGRYFDAYRRLCEGYPAVSKEQAAALLEEYPPEEDNWTEAVRNQLTALDKDGLFEGRNEEINRFFQENACRKQRLDNREFARTAANEFYSLWEELKERLDDSGEITRMLKEDKLLKKEQGRERFVRTMTIQYDPEKTLSLSRGTRFTCRTLVRAADGEDTAVFAATKDEILPAAETEVVEVRVRALLSEEEFEGMFERGLKKVLKKKAQFVSGELLKNEHVEIEAEEATPGSGISSIDVGEKVRFAQAAGKKNEGVLAVRCKVGTFFPRGTRFHFVLAGYTFTYESIEDANTAVFRIPVRPLTRWGDGQSKSRTGNLCAKKHMPLKVRGGEGDGLQGFLLAETGKSGSLGLFWEGQPENFIQVTGEKTLRIPRGTVFVYEYEGQEYEFACMEETDKKPFAEADIEVEWLNVQEFQKTADASGTGSADTKGVEFIASDTEFEAELKHIYRAYTRKRAALYPGREDMASEQELQSSVSAVLRYIYTVEKGKEGNRTHYEGFPEYGEDFFLNTKIFKDTRITWSLLSSLTGDEERLRNLILTLEFLKFVWDDDVYGDNANMLIADFETEADREMIACGFQPFYRRGYPYDGFLALLLNCDEPLALFQAIWSDQQPLRQKKERNVQ